MTMRNLGVAFALWGIMVVALPAHAAETLQDAFVKAYNTSPALQAERASLRAVDEEVAAANSFWRPSVSGVAAIGRTDETRITTTDGGQIRHPRTLGVTVTQPVFRGFRTVSGIRSAINRVKAARADLDNAEQNLLVDVAAAYMDVYRGVAELNLRRNNEDVLQRQLDAANDRFRVGELTRTDVSQAESRQARAAADRIEAEGNLEIARANYVRLVGTMPEELEKPTVTLIEPRTLNEAVELATKNNPVVVASGFVSESAENDVTSAMGNLLPEVNLNGQAGRSWDQSFIGPHRMDEMSVEARMTIPLYTGGADYARTRQAKQVASQRQLELAESQRRAREAAVQAWQQLSTARAAIKSRRAQVEAAELALEGVRQEADVGTRTTLDVLDAEQELLDARVDMVRAERDEIVAIYQTKAAIGEMTAKSLGLPVQIYDPTEYYEEHASSFFGLGIE